MLGLLGFAHVAVSLFAVVPGYLSVDEGTFHWMVKGLAETGSFEIWNGYREFPSPALASASVVEHAGRLVGQPPYLHPLLGVPFYRALGYRGLFLLNAIAFGAAVWLTFLIGRRLLARVESALDACLVLVLATFAWEYSQAAWTHSTALAANLASVYCVVRALQASTRRQSLMAACLAGFVAGFGLGIRLDGVLLLAVIPLAFLFARPWKPGPAVASVLGALPGLVVLSLTNRAKFDTLSPLAMGPEPAGAGTSVVTYLPLAIGAGAVAILALVLHRVDVASFFESRRRRFLVGLVIAGLLVLTFPAPRTIVWRQVTGTYRIAVDMRALPMERVERAMTRGDGRAVVYVGGYKKALLQSLPYLPLLLLPAAATVLRRREARGLAVLFLVPLAYLGFYGQYSWHGGLALNQRYLVPTLPYLSLLVAWALHALKERLTDSWRPAALLGGGVVAATFLAAGWTGVRGGEPAASVYLALPLLLAGSLLVALLLALRNPAIGSGLSRSIGALTAASMVWAVLVAFTYDYPLARSTRGHNLRTGRAVAEIIPPDSLVFTPLPDRLFTLIESDRVRLALPSGDHPEVFRSLARFHLDAGRSVFGAFNDLQWQFLRASHLRGFQVRPVWESSEFTLAEISHDPDVGAASRR